MTTLNIPMSMVAPTTSPTTTTAAPTNTNGAPSPSRVVGSTTSTPKAGPVTAALSMLSDPVAALSDYLKRKGIENGLKQSNTPKYLFKVIDTGKKIGDRPICAIVCTDTFLAEISSHLGKLAPSAGYPPCIKAMAADAHRLLNQMHEPTGTPSSK